LKDFNRLLLGVSTSFAMLGALVLCTSAKAAPIFRGGVFCNELEQMKNLLNKITEMPIQFALQLVNQEKVVCVLHRSQGAVIDKPILVFEETVKGMHFFYYKAHLVGLLNSNSSFTEITPPVVQYLVSQDKFDKHEQVGGI